MGLGHGSSSTIEPFSKLELWHVDADEDVLVTFEIDWKEHPPTVQQTKWSLARGEQLDRKTFRLSVEARHVDWDHPSLRKVERPMLSRSRPGVYNTITDVCYDEHNPYITVASRTNMTSIGSAFAGSSAPKRST